MTNSQQPQDQRLDPAVMEQALLAEFRKGTPVLIGLPCPHCGARIWVQMCPDGSVRQAGHGDLPPGD